MDIVRILVTTYSLVLNETFNVEINDNVFSVKLVEDMHGPKRTVVPNLNKDVGCNGINSYKNDNVWESKNGENMNCFLFTQPINSASEEAVAPNIAVADWKIWNLWKKGMITCA